MLSGIRVPPDGARFASGGRPQPQAREILDHESITVIDYRPLQQACNA
jgi:hypothetical protein